MVDQIEDASSRYHEARSSLHYASKPKLGFVQAANFQRNWGGPLLGVQKPYCLELFGCCCRRLSQHGVGEVMIPLRHCWRDAFFCVCVGSGSFCHDWASHCSVLFWSLDALFVLGSPSSPPGLLTRQLCGSGCVCRPEFNIIRLKNNSIFLKPDKSFVYIGGRVSIS